VGTSGKKRKATAGLESGGDSGGDIDTGGNPEKTGKSNWLDRKME